MHKLCNWLIDRGWLALTCHTGLEYIRKMHTHRNISLFCDCVLYQLNLVTLIHNSTAPIISANVTCFRRL